MALTTQSSFMFSLNSINGVSISKNRVFTSTNFRISHLKTTKILASSSDLNPNASLPKSSDCSEIVSENEPAITDPVKLAFAKAKEYKRSIQAEPLPKTTENLVGNDSLVSDDVSSGSKEIPDSVKLSMEKAREYKKNKGVVGSSNIVGEKEKSSGLTDSNVGNSGDRFNEKNVTKKEGSTISSIDFVGLGFSDKKQSRGLPAGLVPVVDSFSDGDLPDVELIVGDSSRFAPTTPLESGSTEQEDDSDVYKPKVSTWGVFPRPSNISKTYGGGRVIRPGETLETSEDKAAKDARTKKLLAAYKNKMGLVVDPKLKSKCEKALKEGDNLMDTGKFKQALPYYEEVMKEMAFQNELHGLAALQWSICQDSLNRQAEARVMYEKLQSHPDVQVRKKAKQLIFSFQAMEIMKFTDSSFSSSKTGYGNYFDAFVEDKTGYSRRVGEEEEENSGLSQTFPYIILLLSPILVVLLIAVRKGI